MVVTEPKLKCRPPKEPSIHEESHHPRGYYWNLSVVDVIEPQQSKQVVSSLLDIHGYVMKAEAHHLNLKGHSQYTAMYKQFICRASPISKFTFYILMGFNPYYTLSYDKEEF